MKIHSCNWLFFRSGTLDGPLQLAIDRQTHRQTDRQSYLTHTHTYCAVMFAKTKLNSIIIDCMIQSK